MWHWYRDLMNNKLTLALFVAWVRPTTSLSSEHAEVKENMWSVLRPAWRCRLCRWLDAVSGKLNIARTKVEHPFSSTHKGICLQALNWATRDWLLTWCQNSCMYSSSAVDLKAEGLPRSECAHACLPDYVQAWLCGGLCDLLHVSSWP